VWEVLRSKLCTNSPYTLKDLNPVYIELVHTDLRNLQKKIANVAKSASALIEEEGGDFQIFFCNVSDLSNTGWRIYV